MSNNNNNNKNNNNKSATGKKKGAKECKQTGNPDKDNVSTDSLLTFISSASTAMRKALDMTKQGSSSSGGSKKRDPNHRRHLIKNMKESSLEYSAYNKRRYKRRSTSSSSAHNGAESLTDSSEYLTDTMRALFMSSTEETGVCSRNKVERQSYCDMRAAPGGEQFARDAVFFRENQWSADCESVVSTSQHYLTASTDLQLTGSYENSLMPVTAGYIPDPFDQSSSPSYLQSSLDLSESCAMSEHSSLFYSDSSASGSSCRFARDQPAGIPGPLGPPGQNGNMNNNVFAPGAVVSGEFSRVDARLVEHVLAQSDIQTTMNELVDIARPKRQRVSLTPTHDCLFTYLAPSAYPEAPIAPQRRDHAPSSLRPKSWTASRPAQQHKLAHNRQSCPPPVYPGPPAGSSPSCCQGSATGLSPFGGGFFRCWEPPGMQTDL